MSSAPAESASEQCPKPRDWRTGHPDSPQIRAAIVSSILATWREAWPP
ncbi:hypothetical protein OG884_19000 [Streptosporangium sp. NBC_01755]|nr:hypothetical protein [Streptosporangium sp. NBC_01755]WSD03898.1 hypothetical protein OG884_19000 [Streptosporangium sp. NBC_01755]